MINKLRRVILRVRPPLEVTSDELKEPVRTVRRFPWLFAPFSGRSFFGRVHQDFLMTRNELPGRSGKVDLWIMSESSPSYSSSEAFQTLVAHFESNEFRFHADPETKSLQLFITGECAVYNCRLQLTHDDDLIQARVHYPVSARDTKIRPLVAEAIARANHGMSIGRFDIDLDSGEMHFQIGQVIRGHELDDDTIGGVFSAALSTADRYFPAIMRVMFAGHTPADAVYLSEIDVHAAAVAADEPKSAPASKPPKPAAKKPRASPKDSGFKRTKDLPGLFDEAPDKEGGGPRRNKRP